MFTKRHDVYIGVVVDHLRALFEKERLVTSEHVRAQVGRAEHWKEALLVERSLESPRRQHSIRVDHLAVLHFETMHTRMAVEQVLVLFVFELELARTVSVQCAGDPTGHLATNYFGLGVWLAELLE